MPPAGSLKVLRAPARRGEIWHASQTKIYNLETHEFVSNPPFSKNEFGGSNIAIPLWREQLELFKINFKFFFYNYFLTRKHLAKGFFFEKNIPKLNPKVGIISFFHCKHFQYHFLRMFLLDLISMDSIVPWYHSFYPLSSSFSRKKDPTPPSFFDSQHQ